MRRASRRWSSLLLSVVAALPFAGCAGTRIGAVGRLSNDEPRHAGGDGGHGVPSLGTLLGCHVARRVELDERSTVQAVKIVRFTDRLPSTMAFEIEAHELCHAVAALQAMRDP